VNIKNNNHYYDDISSGKIENKSFWFKFGEGEIDTSATTLWSGSDQQAGLYTYPTEAILMNLVSSNAGDTDQTIEIQGLDANYKLQTENVELNGTTPVSTVNKFFRVFRMAVTDGSTLAGWVKLYVSSTIYGHIRAGINQTQMMVYTVPAGHSLLVKSYVLTKADDDAVKIMGMIKTGTGPFRDQFDINMLSGQSSVQIDPPYKMSEKTDFEMRGVATTVKTSDIACNLFGILNREESVPVDITSFTATSGDTQVVLSWDEQTESETADMKGFVVSDGTREVLITDKTASGYTFTGLTNGEEYTFSITWVGYDGKESDTSTATATPNPVIPYFPLLGGLTTTTLSANAGGYITVAEDNTITEGNLALANYLTTGTANDINGVSYISAQDTTDTLPDVIYSFDGTDFTLYNTATGTNTSQVASCPGYAILTIDNVSYGEIEGGDRTALTGDALSGATYCGMYGSQYMTHAFGTTVRLSNDGIAFTELASPAGVTLINAITDGTNIYAAYRDGTTLGFYIYDGSWTLATTSFTVADNSHVAYMAVYDGNIYASYLDTVTFAAGFVVSADNGDTWTTATPPDANIIVQPSVANDLLWVTSINAGSGFAAKVWNYDGTTWDTGQAITASNIVLNNSLD
jgi:hypothetical protein